MFMRGFSFLLSGQLGKAESTKNLHTFNEPYAKND